jgi:5-methylcytosine-specific restriction endonuclease McrA
MPWLKVDEGFVEHPKVIAAELRLKGRHRRGRVVAVWLEMACFAARNLTDGAIPSIVAKKLHTDHKPLEVIAAMVKAGLVHRTADGFLLHDFGAYNPSAAEVKAKRDWDAFRKRLYSIPGLVDAIRERDGNRCRYCGRTVNWKDRRSAIGGTYDHVIPRGPNSLENVVVCCLSCNNKKGARTPEQARMPLLLPSSELVRDLKLASSNQVGDQCYPDPTRPDRKDQDPPALRAGSFPQAVENLETVRQALRSALHAYLDSKPGPIDLVDLTEEAKQLAARAFRVDYSRGRDLEAIVDSVVAEREKRRVG